MVAPALLFILIASWSAHVVDSSIPRSSSGALVRVHPSETTCSDAAADKTHQRPAWNPSPLINHQGYLCEQLYRRIPGDWEADCPHTSYPNNKSQDLDIPVIIRQVPGDGDCLFHAVAISLNLIQGGRHLTMDSTNSLWALKDTSRRLRRMAVECLRSYNVDHPHKSRLPFNNRPHHSDSKIRKAKRYKRLFIQGCESMATSQLLSTAASQYGISSQEYCDLMEQDSYWGGGPEIVALCNVLKRPIHVYELVAASRKSSSLDMDRVCRDACQRIRVPDPFVNKEFALRRMATFGSPKYDSKEPLRILSADSRFPDVLPECIRENGNHFMAIFPVDLMERWVDTATTTTCESNENEVFNSDRKRRVRGGAACSAASNELVEETEEPLVFHRDWFDNFNYSFPLEGKNEWEELDPSTTLRVSTIPWYQKFKRELPEQNQQGELSSRQNAMKQVIGSWLNVFVWKLSHFHRF